MKYRFLLTGIFLIVVTLLVFWMNKPTNSYIPISEPPHPQIDSLFNLMDQALRHRNYTEGKQMASTALNLSRREKYRYGEVNSLTALGFIFNHQAKYDSALALLETARKLVRKYKLEPALRHRAATFLSTSYTVLGKSEKALDILNEARRYFETSGDTLRLCAVYNDLGLLYQQLGRYGEAEKIFTQGLSIAKVLSKESYYERSFIGNLGILFRELGEYDRAVPLIEASLRIGREMNDPTAQAIDLIHLGGINLTRGDFRLAIRQYLEAARLSLQVGENKEAISAYRHVGEVYAAMNDDSQAEHYYREAQAIIDDRLAGNHHLFPWLDSQIGMHFIARGELDSAEVYLSRALPGYQASKIPLDLGLYHLDVAQLYIKQGKYEGALEHVAQAEALFAEIKAPDAYYARAYLISGMAQYALGASDSAAVLFHRALKACREVNQPEIVWQANAQLSRYHQVRGELSQAADFARRAIDTIEHLRHYTITPELSIRYFTDKMEVYDHYFDILYAQYQQAPQQTALEALFALTEQTRSRALLEHLHAGMENVFSSYTRNAKLQTIESQMAALNRLIRDELLKPQAERRQQLVKDWQDQLAELEQAYRRSSVQFAAAHPELSSLVGISPRVSLKEIQQQLSPGQAILSYYISREAVYGFAISTRTVILRKLPLTPQELNSSVNRLLEPFRAYKSGQIDFLRLPFDGALSHRLYMQVLAPLLTLPREVHRFTIIPDGILHYLPFEMLVVEEKAVKHPGRDAAFDEFRRYRFWLEEATVSYLPACSVLPLLQSKPHRQTAHTLLAMGNPVSSAAVPSTDTLLAALSPPEGLRALALTPLPGASREILGIRQIFGEHGVLGLTGKLASEATYKQMAGQYRYLHFATHGYVDEVNPNFSALLLHPGNTKEDGFLYVYEIYTTPLQAELVSLSACESGLGKLQAGEGLISFVQAFLSAGSRNVMASLWSVEESTYPLMVNFYKNIHAGMEIAEALRQAKLSFMKGHSRRTGGGTYTNIHPFLWAPFVVFGVD